MRLSSFFLLAFVSLALSLSCTQKSPGPSITNQGGIDIISLYGTWEEMGEQYGRLAGDHLRHVNDFLTDIIDDDPEKKESIQNVADNLYSRYPYRFRQFFEGMEKTSGLSMEQLVMNNAVEYAEGFFCSAAAAWGEYASGDLVVGRNYDAQSYGPIADDIILTVFHPSDGSLSTATFGYAGEIYAVNAINEKGIFLELNSGVPSAGRGFDFERFAGTTSLLEAMFDAYDLDYLDAFFKTHRSSAAFIIGIADESEARSYEWCATGTEDATAENAEGLMVMTNYFVSPNWTYPAPPADDSWMSVLRRCNLISLAERNKGRIDADAMCRIIATPIEDGGAMNVFTRYQLVYSPKTMSLLVRTERSPEWIGIDMNSLFHQGL